MTRCLILALMLATTGCTTTKYVFPDAPPPIPELPEELKIACPGLPPLKDKSVVTLVDSDYEIVYKYARCKNKNKSLIAHSVLIQQQYNDYIKAYEKAKKDAKK